MAGYKRVHRRDAIEQYNWSLKGNFNTINLYIVDKTEDVFREGLLKKLTLPPKDAKTGRREIETVPQFEDWIKPQLEAWGITSYDFYTFSARAW